VEHLALIARLPANVQKEMIGDVKNSSWRWRNVSTRDLKERIGSALNLLSRAKWSLDDETLVPKAGACSKCRKRSGAEPLLWFDTVTDQIKTKDRCLDGGCWEQKLYSYIQQRAKKLSEEHQNLIYILNGATSYDTDETLSKKFGKVLHGHQYKRSGKTAKGASPALVVHGKGAGHLVWVKENKFTVPGGARRTGRPTPLKERRASLKAKRWAQVLRVLREKVEEADVKQVVCKDKITGIMALVAVYGNQPAWGLNIKARQNEIKRLCDHKCKNPTDAYPEALISLWNSFKPTLDNLLTYNGPVTQTSDSYIEEAKWIAELIGADIKAMFEEVSRQKGFTEPKAWAGLNEDGTPKKKKS